MFSALLAVSKRNFASRRIAKCVQDIEFEFGAFSSCEGQLTHTTAVCSSVYVKKDGSSHQSLATCQKQAEEESGIKKEEEGHTFFQQLAFKCMIYRGLGI